MKISNLTIFCLSSLNVYENEFDQESINMRIAFDLLNKEKIIISEKVNRVLFSTDNDINIAYYLKKFRWHFEKNNKGNLLLQEEEINSLAITILFLLRSYLIKSDANLLCILFNNNSEETNINLIRNLLYEYTFFS